METSSLQPTPGPKHRPPKEVEALRKERDELLQRLEMPRGFIGGHRRSQGSKAKKSEKLRVQSIQMEGI